MMADLVIAAEDADRPPRRASAPATAANWPLIIGMRRAKELLFTGDTAGAPPKTWAWLTAPCPPTSSSAESSAGLTASR
jgi:hypothetical protein